MKLSSLFVPGPVKTSVKTSVKPTLILHGLFGSKQNWRSLAKSLKMPVYALDLRNHGESPHGPHSYAAMASDVVEFITDNSLESVNLIGHSMGGKLAMTLALDPSHVWLNKLVVVDMAPVHQINATTTLFGSYIKTMKAIEKSRVSSVSEADAMLQSVAPELAVRQFLLTNLKMVNGSYTFRNNLHEIEAGLTSLWSFPSPETILPCTKPALFIGGSRSDYITHEMTPLIQAYFPNNSIQWLDAGHWVHAEKPLEFVQLTREFLAD